MAIKYADRKLLVTINNRAIVEKRNVSVAPEVLRQLDDLLFPVTQTLFHDVDSRVRCKFILDGQARSVWIDLTMDEYRQLPMWEAVS